MLVTLLLIASTVDVVDADGSAAKRGVGLFLFMLFAMRFWVQLICEI